ncbi:alpha/beta hydrolase [Sulfurimonas sp. CS5]|uniref:alpha/beta hydrolase n=1 Tax=Sulfurimonas sp. CS5 TaxID=3391145 RepID=UPI0039E88C96
MIYIAFLLFTFLIILFALYQGQYFLIFSPTYFREGEFSSGCEIFSITADDEVELEGVVYEPSDAKNTILFFGGREHDSVGLIDRLAENFKDSRIITFNYRSYGRSGGVASEKNILKDALKIATIVQKNYGDFYILGFSLGTSVAASVASRHKTFGVFLLGAFDSILLMAKTKYGVVFSWMLKYKFDNVEFVKKIKAPTYLFASKSDEVVDIKNARNLKNSVKELAFYKEFDGLSHKELLWNDEVVKNINGVLS